MKLDTNVQELGIATATNKPGTPIPVGTYPSAITITL